METQISDSGRDDQSEPTLIIPREPDESASVAVEAEPSTAPTMMAEIFSPPAEPTVVSHVVEPPRLTFEPPSQPASFEAPPPPPAPSAPTKSSGNSRTWLIVAIVAVLLCCCCCGLVGVIAAVMTEGQDWSSVLWGFAPLA